ncbi:MAG: hypothetical protein JSV03_16590, partial [Planctomycetota bacterium]
KVIFVSGSTSPETSEEPEQKAEANSPTTQPTASSTTQPADSHSSQVSAPPIPHRIDPEPLRREMSITASHFPE